MIAPLNQTVSRCVIKLNTSKQLSVMKQQDYNQEVEKALQDLPGAAIDTADNEKVDPALVEERTKTLNDNPRKDQTPVV